MPMANRIPLPRSLKQSWKISYALRHVFSAQPLVTPQEPSSIRETPLAVRIVRGGAAVALSSYFLFGFGFLANLLLTRLLDPADFGIFVLGTFFYSLLNLRQKLGVDQAFAQHAVTDAKSSGTHAVLSVATGIASLGLALIAAPILIALGYAEPVILVTLGLAGVGLSDSVMGVAWVQLDKSLNFTRVSLVTTIAFPLSYLPAVYLAFNHGGYWALLAQNIAYSLLLLGGLWFTARRTLPDIWRLRWEFSRTLAHQFIRFGVIVGLSATFAALLYQFDNFLVGTFVGMAILGYYDRAYRIAQWSSILVGSVLQRTTFYAYSRLQNDSVRLTKTAMMSLWIVTTIALPIALAIFITSDDLVRFLFGEKWLPSALFLRFLVVYSLLRPLLDDATSLFIAVGHPRRTTTVTILQAAALILAATPLTFQFGAVGTAIGVGVAFIVGLTVTYYFVRRTLPALSLRDAFVIPSLAALVTLATGLALSPMIRTLPLSLFFSLALQSSLVIATYLIITIILRPTITRERAGYVWRLMRNQIPLAQEGLEA